LAVWQARGRRAWEEAEAAAERATGTLAPLLIVPPPLAGLPVPVLSPIPAFAIPPGLVPADCGAQDGTTLASRESTKALLQRLAAQLATTWPALAAVLAAAAKELEQELEDEAVAGAGEGIAGAEGAVKAAARGTRIPDVILDATGKAHGQLPSPADLGEYDTEALETLRDELEQSAQKRIAKTVQLGADYGHSARIAEEQALIRSITKYLADTR
jgi:hypothetical protein